MAPTWRIDELAQKAGADRRHHPLLRPRGPAAAARAGRPPQALRPRAPRPPDPHPRSPGRSASPSPRSAPSSTPIDPASSASSPTNVDRQYSLDDLIERSGVASDVVDGLRAVGLLPDPAEFGARRLRRQRPRRAAGHRRAARDRHDAPRSSWSSGAIYVRALRARCSTTCSTCSPATTAPTGTPTSSCALQQQLTANTPRHDPGDRPGPELRAPAHDPTPHAGSVAHGRGDPHRDRRRPRPRRGQRTDRRVVRARCPRCAPRCRR